MLCTQHHLILKIAPFFEETFSPPMINVMERVADYKDKNSFIVDAEHIKDMADTLFCTAAGMELHALKQSIIRHNIDWVEIIYL